MQSALDVAVPVQVDSVARTSWIPLLIHILVVGHRVHGHVAVLTRRAGGQGHPGLSPCHVLHLCLDGIKGRGVSRSDGGVGPVEGVAGGRRAGVVVGEVGGGRRRRDLVGGGGSRGAGRVGRGVEVVMRGVQVGVRGVGVESVQVGRPGLLTDVLVHWVLVTIYGVVDHGGDCPLDWSLRLAYWKNGRS